MLEINKNSYVTIAEADEYINGRYKSKDRKRWQDTNEQEKIILLINACAELELLPYTGRKVGHNQVLSFPRLPQQYGRSQEPPQNIKHAQIELALLLSDESKVEQLNQRIELKAQGVKAFNIGDLSESYKDEVIKPIPLAYPKIAQLIAPYLGGGHNIC